MYEKQPFIGEVHELTVEFGDDIMTIFPILNIMLSPHLVPMYYIDSYIHTFSLYGGPKYVGS